MVGAGGLLRHRSRTHHRVVARRREAVGWCLDDVGEILPVGGGVVGEYRAAGDADRHHAIHRAEGVGEDSGRRAAEHLYLAHCAVVGVSVVAYGGDAVREGEPTTEIHAAVEGVAANGSQRLRQLAAQQACATHKGLVADAGNAVTPADVLQAVAVLERLVADSLHAIAQRYLHQPVAPRESPLANAPRIGRHRQYVIAVGESILTNLNSTFYCRHYYCSPIVMKCMCPYTDSIIKINGTINPTKTERRIPNIPNIL